MTGPQTDPALAPGAAGAPRHLVVVGGGMVAQRLVEALRARDAAGAWRVSVFAEEPRAPRSSS